MKNGCFRKRGYVYTSSLKGGSSDKSLSSFVLIALLEASDRMELIVDRTKINRALECIMANLDITDIYSYTVATYAANLMQKKLQDVDTRVEDLWPHVKKMANASAALIVIFIKVSIQVVTKKCPLAGHHRQGRSGPRSRTGAGRWRWSPACPWQRWVAARADKLSINMRFLLILSVIILLFLLLTGGAVYMNERTIPLFIYSRD